MPSKKVRDVPAQNVLKKSRCLWVRPGIDHPRSEERLDFRAPEQPAISLRVVERADTDPVAAEDQRPRLCGPRRDGELAAGLLEDALAMIFVEMDPQLGVASGRQPVAARQQLLLELGIFEELAVLRDPDRAVLVADRLPAAGEVDDREPPRPMATPGSRWICSSSGPRWAIAPVIASSRAAGNSRRPFRSIAPAIPHMVETLHGCWIAPNGRPGGRLRSRRDPLPALTPLAPAGTSGGGVRPNP